MRNARSWAAAVALVTGGGALVALASPTAVAEEAAAPRPTTVAKKLVTPLSMDVARNGTVWVSQNFAGLLTRKDPGRRARVVWAAPKGTEVGALSVSGRSVRLATTKGKKTALWRIGPAGTPRKLADLWAYERKNNPDGDVTYGFQGITDECAAQVPEEVPVSYDGIKESHPYATAVHKGVTYVADAAGNTILKVNRRGKVSTVAVLPPVPVVVTAEIAGGAGLPDCTVGLSYWFEPVPTDVEVGGKRKLYATLLPGGPEDGSTGANGQVVSIRTTNGKVRTIAGGLLGATGVAVGRNGDLFVAQLFGGEISRIKKGSGTATTWASVMMPAAVEWSRGDVYATTNVLSEPPNGKVLRY